MTVSGYAFTLMGSRAVGEFAIMKAKVKGKNVERSSEHTRCRISSRGHLFLQVLGMIEQFPYQSPATELFAIERQCWCLNVSRNQIHTVAFTHSRSLSRHQYQSRASILFPDTSISTGIDVLALFVHFAVAL